MKKSVSTSLALAALALAAAGGIALLGGPNVFSVLSNIKFPSKPKIDRPPVEEKEAVIEEKQEKETVATELALEAKAQEVSAEQPIIEREEVRQEPEVSAKSAPIREPQKQVQKTQKSTFTAPKIPPNATQKKSLGNGKYTLTFQRGETVEYNEHGTPVWSSWHGRLTETQEERDWLNGYVPLNKRGSSGSKGKGVWCLTPSGNHNVDQTEDCLKVPGWRTY